MGTMSASRLAIAFAAGFLAVPLCHQVMAAVLHAAGILPNAPWSIAPVPPFGVPQILSISFFGGLWGIVLRFVLGRFGGRGARRLLVAAVFSGIALTLVAFLVVFPLKGISPASLPPAAPLIGFVLNAVWGIGAMLMMDVAERRLSVGAAG